MFLSVDLFCVLYEGYDLYGAFKLCFNFIYNAIFNLLNFIRCVIFLSAFVILVI